MKARVWRERGCLGVYIKNLCTGYGCRTEDVETNVLVSPGISNLYYMRTRLLCMHIMWF